MEEVLLSRWQFAITTIYHFLFVPLTLGMAIFVALLETCYVRTKNPEWKKTCRKLLNFFGTLFLINFAMGVVTGLVQEFQFGMNWSEYARFMGDIFGAPLALEALTAFFLESTFLGIWMFGWDKLSEKAHCACIWLVAIGSNLSAFWILVANSFMQHPVGYTLANGRAEMASFGELITNHYILGEQSHTLFAGITTAGFVVMAVSAWKLLNDSASRYAFTQAIKAGAIYTMVGVVGVIASGHFHTQYLAQASPMKLAAMEALWDTEDPAPFAVLAYPNMEQGKNDFEITIPYMFSFMVHDKPSGEVRGINDLQKEAVEKYGAGDYRPHVTILFYAFRAMVGAGFFMVLVSFLVYYFAKKNKLESMQKLLFALPWLVVIPFIANSAGWIVAEMGRQPWLVVGLQKTVDGVSPNLTSPEIWFTMLGFTVLYLLLIITALYIAFRFIRRTQITAAPEGGAQ